MVALAPLSAHAREPADDVHTNDLVDFEEEAFGTRGLVRTRAETVSFDAQARSIELAGDVRIDAPPFHLRSNHIKLTRTRYGIEADGKGNIAFCPCLGTPLTIEFDEAIVAPPGELILKAPKLEVYGVPVLYLPWFWMRGEEKVGVLPPDIAYRGQDGLFLGEGVHLPWKDGGARRALDLRGGAYVDGGRVPEGRAGFATEARLRTEASSTRIRFDRFPGSRAPTLPGAVSTNADDGLVVDARGADNRDDRTVAWDADVLRGRRGVAATTDVDAAARPWDRADASATLRPAGPFAVETGVRAVTRRGSDLASVDAWGPFAALRSSGAIAHNVTYDATFEGGALRVSGPAASATARVPPPITPDSVSYGRAEAGFLASTAVGPLDTSLSARGAGDIAAEGRRDGGDRAATARLRLGAPFARSFGEVRDGDAPVVHVVEPFAEASVLHAGGNAILGTLPGRGLATMSGTAPITDAGLSTALGRWSRREAVEMVLAAGAAYGADGAHGLTARTIARGELSATHPIFGARVDSGHVLPGAGDAGDVVVARVRIGPADGLRVVANVATRDGIDPTLARALSDGAIEAPAGFLASRGTTGGAGVVIPWFRALSTSAGVDVDATHQELVAARAGLELRDRCNCVTLRANGAHRIGRDGVDVWIALDFTADR